MRNILKLTESEKERILKLHSKFKTMLVEQGQSEFGPQNEPTPPPTTTTTTTAPPTTTTTTTAPPERWRTATCQGLNKKPACKDKVLQVQMKINDRCPTGKLSKKLVEDGIWGPKTNSAFTACGGVITKPGQTTGGTQTGQTTGGTQTGQTTGGTQTGQTTGGTQTGQTTGGTQTGQTTGGTAPTSIPSSET